MKSVSMIPRILLARSIQLGLLITGLVSGFTTRQILTTTPLSSSPDESRLWSRFGAGGQDDQAAEALQSLVDFHEGRWTGKARSFSVVPDTAAGIVQRKVSPEYEISVKLGLNSNRDYSLTETFSWDGDKIKPRTLSLSECNADVDSVDASYSLDSSLPDFPSAITGTDKLCQFGIEHCIAVSNDKRMRCFVLYSMDQSLQRVVVCEEARVKEGSPSSGGKNPTEANNNNQLTAQDLIEMQYDADRLVERLFGNMSSVGSPSTPSPSTPSEESLGQKLGQSMASDDGAQKLALHDASLLEVSSGVWLGDAIIRDMPKVPDGSSSKGRGFGASSTEVSSTSENSKEFAAWSVGVQKVAWRWMWNFGDEIRQVVDVGKGMGDRLAACLTKSQSGNVCVNESLSRRMPKEERMVYIDWTPNAVGFLVGPAFIHAPRYLSFDQVAGKAQPFFTEFGIFQSTDVESTEKGSSVVIDVNDDEENLNLPQLCFSKVSRVYNHEGRLKQGATSFYTFKRFGVDDLD